MVARVSIKCGVETLLVWIDEYRLVRLASFRGLFGQLETLLLSWPLLQPGGI